MYVDSMYKTFTTYSYIFLYLVGTNKTALDPNDACGGSRVQCAIRSPAWTKKDVILQRTAMMVIVLLLLVIQTVFSCNQYFLTESINCFFKNTF